MTFVGTQPVWKSSARLAGGREIIYFDEAPGLGRDLVRGTRDLPSRPPGAALPAGRPEWGIRWDPLAGEWVIIAAARQDRTFLPPPGQCPLDPSAPGRPTEIPADSSDVVVFENRFPSLAEPLGRCEVVCFTSDHESSFAMLPPSRVRTVLEAWADRTEALSALPETRQVYCFENRGEEIGVTLHHPHGQVYAFPFLAPRLAQMVARASDYARTHDGMSLFDNLVSLLVRVLVTGDPAVLVASPEKIASELGWRAERGLRAMAAYAWHFDQSRSHAPGERPAMGVRGDGISPGEVSRVVHCGQR